MKNLFLFIVIYNMATACNDDNVTSHQNDNQQSTNTPLDTAKINSILGKKGNYNNGEYKVTIPQNDLRNQTGKKANTH